MRRFLFFVVFSVILVSLFARVDAQNTTFAVDVQQLSRGEVSSSKLAGIFVGRNFKNSHFGGWNYTAVTPDWGEFLVGPSTHFVLGDRYVEFGTGAGVEQPGFVLRGAIYGTIVGERFSALVFLEHGKGTGFWYFARAVHKIAGAFSAGLHAQRYFGVGPKFQFDFGPTKIWTAPVYDYESDKHWGLGAGIGVSF